MTLIKCVQQEAPAIINNVKGDDFVDERFRELAFESDRLRTLKRLKLDYMCDGVICPEGHYLCTVAARGHKIIVKPERLGTRHNKMIVCNLKLLVANAFEELLQEKIPFIHKPIRRHYDKIGGLVHKYYFIFNYKIVCDIVFLLMKPLEWLFVFALYCFNRNPENKIAQQYLSRQERLEIQKIRLIAKQ